MWIFKTLAQCVAGCILSSVLVGLSNSNINMHVGGVFELGDGTGKMYSSFGIAKQIPGDKCEMKVVSPFETIPDTIPQSYICSWKDSPPPTKDALCFEPFDCLSLHRLWLLYLITGCVYLVSYSMYGIIWTFGYLGWVRRRRRSDIMYVFIILVMLSNFIFNKILDKYLTEVFIEDFSGKIRSIISNNGYPGFRFGGGLVYEIQGAKKISQSLFDICSGMIMGLVFSAIGSIRKPYKPIVSDSDLSEGLIL